jgi:hypothetical protein
LAAGPPEKNKKREKVRRLLARSAQLKVNVQDKKICFCVLKSWYKTVPTHFFSGTKVYQSDFFVVQNCTKINFWCKQLNPWLCQVWQCNCKHVFLMLFLCFCWVREFFCMI